MRALTIHKDILKKEYAKSPLGIVERKLTKIYDGLKLKNEALPEEISKQIFDIRDAQEKEMEEYIQMTLKRDREAGDEILLKNMSAELEIIEKYLDGKN